MKKCNCQNEDNSHNHRLKVTWSEFLVCGTKADALEPKLDR